MKLSKLKDQKTALLAILAVSGWGLLLLGAGGPPTRIAVVNTDKITNSSVQVQNLLKEASTEATALGEELKKKQEEYRKAAERYNSQLSVTSEDEKKRRFEEIKKMGEDIEELTFRFNREMKNAQEKAVEPLRERIVTAIEDLARSSDIAVVLSTENTIYYSPQIDLTNAVVARIDAAN